MAKENINLMDKMKYKLCFIEGKRKGTEIETEILMDELEVFGLSETLENNKVIDETEYGSYEVLKREFLEEDVI